MATELRAESQIDINGNRSSWAKFVESNEVAITEIRRMHDELVTYGVTQFAGTSEVWLVRA